MTLPMSLSATSLRGRQAMDTMHGEQLPAALRSLLRDEIVVVHCRCVAAGVHAAIEVQHPDWHLSKPGLLRIRRNTKHKVTCCSATLLLQRVQP